MKTTLSSLAILGTGAFIWSFSTACSSDPLSGEEGQAGAPQSGGSAGSAGSAGGGGNPPLTFGTAVFESTVPRSVTALAFHPEKDDELWATVRDFATGQLCTQAELASCAALEGRVAIVGAASSDEPSSVVKKDDNAWHFMRRPTSIAFGVGGLFATCGESRTANFEDEAADFTGPALWDSDPAIFGQPQMGAQNGRHIDMLHETPFCMGLAHERENVFWAFNGDVGALDRYDFNEPHEIGGSDHSDGELYRYAEGRLSRVEGVPSHLAYDAASDYLYVADTGNARIARLDAASGTMGSPIVPLEGMQVSVNMEGALLETLVASGLSAPSGLVLHDGLLVVTDNATSQILTFDLEGALLDTLDTGLPAGSLGGIALGADGTAYVADLLTGRVLRADEYVLPGDTP